VHQCGPQLFVSLTASISVTTAAPERSGAARGVGRAAGVRFDGERLGEQVHLRFIEDSRPCCGCQFVHRVSVPLHSRVARPSTPTSTSLFYYCKQNFGGHSPRPGTDTLRWTHAAWCIFSRCARSYPCHGGHFSTGATSCLGPQKTKKPLAPVVGVRGML